MHPCIRIHLSAYLLFYLLYLHLHLFSIISSAVYALHSLPQPQSLSVSSLSLALPLSLSPTPSLYHCVSALPPSCTYLSSSTRPVYTRIARRSSPSLIPPFSGDSVSICQRQYHSLISRPTLNELHSSMGSAVSPVPPSLSSA